jgi:hypothetical protein
LLSGKIKANQQKICQNQIKSADFPCLFLMAEKPKPARILKGKLCSEARRPESYDRKDGWFRKNVAKKETDRQKNNFLQPENQSGSSGNENRYRLL